MTPADIHDIFPDHFDVFIDSGAVVLTLGHPWELEQLDVGGNFDIVWQALALDHDRPRNIVKAGEQLQDVLHIWKTTAVPEKMAGAVPDVPYLFTRASKAYDTEIISVVLDHADVFEAMKAWCVDKGLDSMIDSYFAGVPIDYLVGR
jgi:hypothetical protein